jgi:hypothetical protein
MSKYILKIKKLTHRRFNSEMKIARNETMPGITTDSIASAEVSVTFCWFIKVEFLFDVALVGKFSKENRIKGIKTILNSERNEIILGI